MSVLAPSPAIHDEKKEELIEPKDLELITVAGTHPAKEEELKVAADGKPDEKKPGDA